MVSRLLDILKEYRTKFLQSISIKFRRRGDCNNMLRLTWLSKVRAQLRWFWHDQFSTETIVSTSITYFWGFTPFGHWSWSDSYLHSPLPPLQVQAKKYNMVLWIPRHSVLSSMSKSELWRVGTEVHKVKRNHHQFRDDCKNEWMHVVDQFPHPFRLLQRTRN